MSKKKGKCKDTNEWEVSCSTERHTVETFAVAIIKDGSVIGWRARGNFSKIISFLFKGQTQYMSRCDTREPVNLGDEEGMRVACQLYLRDRICILRYYKHLSGNR